MQLKLRSNTATREGKIRPEPEEGESGFPDERGVRVVKRRIGVTDARAWLKEISLVTQLPDFWNST